MEEFWQIKISSNKLQRLTEWKELCIAEDEDNSLL